MSHFFALISRMKFINRWALMRNTADENLTTHSFDTAVIAHSLAVIGNTRCGKHYNAERAAVLALYHDASEIITGDMPTPVKYFNPEIVTAYKSVEKIASDRLVSRLPKDMQPEYREIFSCESEEDKQLKPLVKAADKLSALIKCIEEIKMGNDDFLKAKDSVLSSVKALNCAEADIFLSEFIESFSLTLDELN